MTPAHSPEEAPYREGDAAAWDRPLRESELYSPERRDIFNFIDETKVRHLRRSCPTSGCACSRLAFPFATYLTSALDRYGVRCDDPFVTGRRLLALLPPPCAAVRQHG